MTEQDVDSQVLTEMRRQTRALEGIRAVVTVWLILSVLVGLIVWIVVASS